ncbi:hypothetical protein L484_014634 [Morus notabilis]|uniref:Uncharacterized protein n=1 Tax=Morus notabilis TaxID=981085 RepID=W9R945_9ROSA|nr:hypothetical protein L484_014634 [Morus notabilis]
MKLNSNHCHRSYYFFAGITNPERLRIVRVANPGLPPINSTVYAANHRSNLLERFEALDAAAPQTGAAAPARAQRSTAARMHVLLRQRAATHFRLLFRACGFYQTRCSSSTANLRLDGAQRGCESRSRKRSATYLGSRCPIEDAVDDVATSTSLRTHRCLDREELPEVVDGVAGMDLVRD